MSGVAALGISFEAKIGLLNPVVSKGSRSRSIFGGLSPPVSPQSGKAHGYTLLTTTPPFPARGDSRLAGLRAQLC